VHSGSPAHTRSPPIFDTHPSHAARVRSPPISSYIHARVVAITETEGSNHLFTLRVYFSTRRLRVIRYLQDFTGLRAALVRNCSRRKGMREQVAGREYDWPEAQAQGCLPYSSRDHGSQLESQPWDDFPPLPRPGWFKPDFPALMRWKSMLNRFLREVMVRMLDSESYWFEVMDFLGIDHLVRVRQHQSDMNTFLKLFRSQSPAVCAQTPQEWASKRVCDELRHFCGTGQVAGRIQQQEAREERASARVETPGSNTASPDRARADPEPPVFLLLKRVYVSGHEAQGE